MAIYAVVQSGVVKNLVEWNGDTKGWKPPTGMKAVVVPSGMTIGIGWTYANGTFSPPA